MHVHAGGRKREIGLPSTARHWPLSTAQHVTMPQEYEMVQATDADDGEEGVGTSTERDSLNPGSSAAAGNATFGQSCMNGVNLLLGVGVLSLPYSMRVSGWIAGLTLLLSFSLATNYTGKLIGRMMDSGLNIRSFGDIGYQAFGPVGQTVISAVFSIELFSACGMYLILCGDNLHALISPYYAGLTQGNLAILAGALVYPTTLTKDLALLSRLSALGMLTSCALCVAVLTVGVLNRDRGEGSFLDPVPTVMYTDIETAPLSIGLVMVGFAGHSCFPSIRCSMIEPKRYNAMLNVSYAFTFTVYTTVAALGYMMYGQSTMKEITLNIMTDDGASVTVQRVAQITIVLIVVNPITKFGLTMNPVALMIEETIDEWHGSGDAALDDTHTGSEEEHTDAELENGAINNGTADTGSADDDKALVAPRGGDKGGTWEKSWGQCVTSFVIRSVLTGACLLTALSLPFFARVVGFIGSFCCCFVSVMFPCAAALKLLGPSMSPKERSLNWLLLLYGTICCVWGTAVVFLIDAPGDAPANVPANATAL